MAFGEMRRPGVLACLFAQVGNVGRPCHLHQARPNRRFKSFKAHGVELAPRLGRRIFPNQVAAKVPGRRNASELFKSGMQRPSDRS